MIIHVIISVGLILVILGQSSKGNALEGLAGGAASNVLGSQGASNFLKNATKILAVLFMLNCILLAFQLRSNSKPKVSEAAKTIEKERVTKEANEMQEIPPITEPATE